MARIGITGVETPNIDRRVLYRYISYALTVEELDLADDRVQEFTTGAAYGVDTAAFYIGKELFPDALHRVCVPKGKRHNRIVVADAEPSCAVELVPGGGYRSRDDRIAYAVELVPGGHLKRDDRIVYHSDVLVAFPKTRNEVMRSGTWATIRRARKKGIPVKLWPLSEIRGMLPK